MPARAVVCCWGPECASSRLRFSLGTRGASISSISGSGKGFGRQDFEGCWHNSITWHSTCAHTRARARAPARLMFNYWLSKVLTIMHMNTSTVFANVKTVHAHFHSVAMHLHGVSEHEHLHGVCERENCTCTLPQCGHAPPRCF